MKIIFQYSFSVFLIVFLSVQTFAQKNDSIKVPNTFGGAITLTNKGISTVPNLTLGKPAVIFDMVAGRKKLSFEPTFRFALEGKPWSFLFWWRYKLLNTSKISINLGAHPALSFKTISLSDTGGTTEVIRANRYLAGEISQNYLLSKNISVGMYYLYSRGIENDITRNTNYLAVRCSFVNLKLTDQFFMRIIPQVYYLKMDANDGFYFNSALSITKQNFPLSISANINKIIKSHIPVGEDFLWNVSLIYAFTNKYVKQ